MTRANINYIFQNEGESPRTLFLYWNGDQYPTGMRDFYHIMDFINSDWSIESFKQWIRTNYEGYEAEFIEQPKIYYTDGYITDYSYVFDNGRSEKTISVWNWDKQIFTGNIKKFTSWIKKQK